jgi:hypothetical protein
MAQPKKAPPWNVDTMFEERLARSASDADSKPNCLLNEGNARVPPIKALSYPYMAATNVVSRHISK